MSDEVKKDIKNGDGWVMPEPVFRTSEGYTPGRKPFEDSQADIPTEPGFSGDDETGEVVESTAEAGSNSENAEGTAANVDAVTDGGSADAVGSGQSANAKKQTSPKNNVSAAPNKKDPKKAAPSAPKTAPAKKGGCLSTILSIAGVITLFVVAIVIALIYFLVYYRPADTGTF